MKQAEIKALLQEAASEDCTGERQNQIQCILGEATAAMGADGSYANFTSEAGMHTLMETIYVDTLRNRPEMLPSLFPLFATVCGDRKEGIIVADVDWSLVP